MGNADTITLCCNRQTVRDVWQFVCRTKSDEPPFLAQPLLGWTRGAAAHPYRRSRRNMSYEPPLRKAVAASLAAPSEPRLRSGRSPAIAEKGRNCSAIEHARRAAVLIDAQAYFQAFKQAAERAQRSILILAWDFNSETRLHYDPVGHGGAPAELGDFLNWLVKRRRTLQVHVLDWDYPMVFGTDREFPPVFGLGWQARRRVHLRYDNTHPVGGSHHQKIVVIDDAMAFVGGIDLTCRRWDTPAHGACDPRRVYGDDAYPPFHDLMIAVDGETAKALGRIARSRWFGATRHILLPVVGVSEDPWPPSLRPDFNDVEVAIACTAPPVGERPGVREVETLYLDMIAAARRSIYIENQYFTAHRLAEALAARLGEADGPQIVLVLRLLSHGWLEEHTMHVLRARLLKQLANADRYHRFHVYYPYIDGLKEDTCIDVHAKLMIVDDDILRIGSANLCNRSMGMDTECDLAIEARGRDDVRAIIRSIRHRLLAEHLESTEQRVSEEVQRLGTLPPVIAALGQQTRTLKVLEELPEWSEPVVSLAEIADPERPVTLDELVGQISPAPPPQRAGPAWGRLLLFAGAIMGLAAVWRYSPLADLLTAEQVSSWARQFAGQPWAPLFILAAYTPACFILFPRPLITLTAVIAFGPGSGFFYAMSGILLAALVTYVAGRQLSRDVVRRLAGERLNAVTQALRRRGLLAVTALRLVPLAPFAVEGLVAGAIHIKLWEFMLGTFIGMLPGTLAATLFGEQIEAALHDPGRINYGLLATIVIALAALTLVVRRQFFSRPKQAAHGRPGERTR
jgi:phospholipase D1/2